MSRAGVLKKLYRQREKILVCITAPSPGAAMMIEAAGFDYTYVSGGVTGSTMFAMPDNGTIGLMEFVWMAKLIAEAVSIPVVADVDACFGGIFHVERAVKELIGVGIAGMRIEDQPLVGKRFGGMAGKEVVPIADAVAKLRVAIDTRSSLDPDFQIVARCEALSASNSRGLPEAVERLLAYKEAGADVLHLEGPRTVDEIAAVRAAVTGPLTANFHALDRDLSPEEAFDLGLCEARYPRLLSGAMATAGEYLLGEFKSRGYSAVRDFYRMFPDSSVVRKPQSQLNDRIRAMEEKYLSAERLEKYK
jgi:2-methylisocitrate lyase-like PEP mutase family enzyme